MYYNKERNELAVMKETQNLFPIEHTCPLCLCDFSFTSLDDIHIGKRDHYSGVYSTIALYSQDLWYECPACKKDVWLSPKVAETGSELKRKDNFIPLELQLKPYVQRHLALQDKHLSFGDRMWRSYRQIHWDIAFWITLVTLVCQFIFW